jgi:hypothetical protein
LFKKLYSDSSARWVGLRSTLLASGAFL